MHEEVITLEEFKKGKRKVFVNFSKNIVEWKKYTYRMKIINGKPHVVVCRVRPLSEIKPYVKTLNERKEEIKGVEYECSNGHSYLVTGIGPDSIKAYKDDSLKEDFYHYFTTEGQYLLETLMDSIGQSVL